MLRGLFGWFGFGFGWVGLVGWVDDFGTIFEAIFGPFFGHVFGGLV